MTQTAADVSPITDTSTLARETEAMSTEDISRIVTKAVARAVQETIEPLEPYIKRQIGSFLRIQRLLNLADIILDDNALLNQNGKPLNLGPRQELGQEILRAAVVLIHAQLEDFLRTIAGNLLPQASEACLDEVPLLGLGKEKKKFYLGKLAEHRGKSVDDLLRESVVEHLKRTTYSSTEEIGNLLKDLGFDPSQHNKNFPMIQRMIERRHQIAHRADRVEESANLVGPFTPITTVDVYIWLEATHDLMQSLNGALAGILSGPNPRTCRPTG